jgi:hypothetical protein
MAGKLNIDWKNPVEVTAKKDLSIEDMREKVVTALEKRGATIVGGVAYVTLTYGTRLIKINGKGKYAVGKMTEEQAEKKMPVIIKSLREELDTGAFDDQIREISAESKNRATATKKKTSKKK